MIIYHIKNKTKMFTEDVKQSYNKISEMCDVSRYLVWDCVKEYINKLDRNLRILEVGCGNGKNMKYLKDEQFEFVQGCDFSENLVKICKKNNLNVIENDILNLSYCDNSFDVILCVAVLHHLLNIEDQKNAIKEMIRVVKPNGQIFIVVNSTMDFSKNIKFLSEQNLMVYFDDKIEIFYHLFLAEELTNLCANIHGGENIYETYNNGYRIGTIYVNK